MKIFNLPDLGEGLAEAEIHEWHVKEGDVVKVDQPMVSVETAKAVVEVPSPQAGKIVKLFGKAGDIIQTDGPLVGFEGEAAPTKDKGTVVGSLEESSTVLDDNIIIGSAVKTAAHTIKAMPVVRALAKQLNVDLHLIKPTGPQGQVTIDDVKAFSQKGNIASHHSKFEGNVEALHGVRRAMAIAMTHSHSEVVPVTVIDDADLTHITQGFDITSHIIQAIVKAVKVEPSLNAWYDGKTMERCLMNEVNVGLAVDTEEGLFVPVIKDAGKKSTDELRTTIDGFKQSVRARSVSPSELQGATITLSNFGMIAGRYATPIVIPPMVAIIGCGKIRKVATVHNGEVAVRQMIPLSLTFDHRAVTGGEATRFLAAFIKNLEAT